MFKDIRLHGYANEVIEFTAIAAGADAYGRYFYNAGQSDADGIRFFSPGNEFIIDRSGVSYRGNGGFCCEYMFGVEQPLADLVKEDVSNRLVLYGTGYRDGGTLSFSPTTEGHQSYEKIFFDGNAVLNYFFTVSAAGFSGTIQEQQERIIRVLGKALKRSPAVGEGNDDAIVREILYLLDDPTAHLLLFKLIHLGHREYRDAFRSLYLANKKIPEPEFRSLTEVADRHRIDRYQQERMRIDVMYRHPDNRRIVDEYRKVLTACHLKGEVGKFDNARLTRLKTLSVRKKIPGALFYTIDSMLKAEPKPEHQEEKSYLTETREIIAGIFLSEREIESSIETEDMLKLLWAKKKAADSRDRAFEEMLLEAGRSCDEKIRDGADISLLDGFSYIITYFDRYDSTASMINNLAFMENVKVTEDHIRSVLGHKNAFDELSPKIFEQLFLTGVLEDRYLGNYGRKKITELAKGLALIQESRLSIKDLVEKLLRIDFEERLHITLREQIKERIRTFYSRYSTAADQEALRREVARELAHKGVFNAEIPQHLFHEAVLTVQKEVFYIQNLLPRIIEEKNNELREDFLQNSGLDRFYIEELEREFFNNEQ
ncbi:TIGR04442 family protein [Geomesophilobacter sediminis]|uniref:TIGR04442 family protein n=1 Tax=Geomesophilobacter sediminis TaxID=2798584 RepID=A0A8J7SBR1_9BACT|nr:TIGR04442 family protein [Geomesophilobacter sediminis]MBJ6726494.1 TIGR04442 family protein [Geomesophilobacter sediminis]